MTTIVINMINAYILTTYQQQDSIRNNLRAVINPDRVVLSLNHVPKGYVVYVTGINFESDKRLYGKDYDIRKFTEIFDHES